MARDQLLLVLIAVFGLLVVVRERSAFAKKHFSSALVSLALLAGVAHVNFFAWHPGNVHVHNLEMYHYYMGTKYFPEVGYTGLYDASLVADSEDDPYFDPRLRLRSLKTYQIVPRDQVLKRRAEIVSAFTSARWMQFRQDLGVFRATAAPGHWGSTFSYFDHGYNGTPLITEVLSDIAAQPFIGTRDFIFFAAWLDLGLLVVGALILARLLGRDAAAMFLFFTLINPMNDYAMIGGAYLRYMSFVALAVGIACYRRRFFAASGALFAVSGLFRIFPVLWTAALILGMVLAADRFRIWRATRSFHLSFLITTACLVLLTSRTPDPVHGNPWLGFKEQILFHGNALSMNRVGLKTLFAFSDEKNFARISERQARGEPVDWVRESEETFRRRRPYYVGVCGLLMAAALIHLKRADGSESMLAGWVLCFCLLSLSHYYYLFLSLIPLAFAEERKVSVMSAGAFSLMIAMGAFTPLGSPLDRRFFCVSALTLLFLASLLVWKILAPSPSNSRTSPS